MALKKIHTVDNPTRGRTAVVYRDSEWNEYRTKFYRSGIYQKDADSHTDDKTDALDTAAHWVNVDNH